MVGAKQNRENLKSILLAALGVAFIIAYFALVINSPLLQFLRPLTTEQEVLAGAEAFFRELPLAHEGAREKVETRINGPLLDFAQYHRKETGKFPDLSPGYWHIEWAAPGKPGQTEVNGNLPLFYVRYDFKGELIAFSIREDALNEKGGENLSLDDAFLEARYFLETLNIDTSSLVISDRNTQKVADRTLHTLTLKSNLRQYPGLIDKYTVNILGKRVIAFKIDRTVDTAITGDLGEDDSLNVALILMAVIWVTVIFMIIVNFVRRLRRDELEFKRALGVGVSLGLFLFLLVWINTAGDLSGLLIGGSVVGLFGLVAMLIVFPVSESQCRDTWPGKLKVTDLLFQGKWQFRELGAAIMPAFFFAGFTLFLLGLLIVFSTSFNLGNLSFDSGAVGVFQDLGTSTSMFLKNLVLALFITLIIFSFWPAYLKARLDNKALLALGLVVTFNLAGLDLLFFRPVSLSFFMVLPIALIWTFMVLKFEILTVFLALLGVGFFRDLVLVLLTPGKIFGLPGMMTLISLGLFFVLGTYLLFCRRTASDYDSYVPDYVNRIAERERFLKELEIARSVQMRFLPQTVPQFPGLEIVSLCQPAMEVGGDYYDFIQLDDRYMSVLIGDVSGKGVSAAFYMTMIKGIIKTLARKIKEPAELLAEANEIFYENAPRDIFITVIFGIFDLKEETLTIASAGHNPLVAWKEKSKKTELYNPRGIALGFKRGDAYRSIIREQSVSTEPGDIFVFYTDGVSEAMNTKQEIFGEERLREIIESHSQLPPQKLEQRIIEAVNEFSGKAPQHDDFTMVIVKIRPKTT